MRRSVDHRDRSAEENKKEKNYHLSNKSSLRDDRSWRNVIVTAHTRILAAVRERECERNNDLP